MFKIDYCSKVILAIYLVYSLLFISYGIVQLDLTFALSWGIGALATVVLFRIINLLLFFSSNLRFLVNLLVSLLYAQALAYHFRAGSGFDFALMIDNIPEMIYIESNITVFSAFNNWDKLFLLLFAVFMLLSQILKRKLSSQEDGRLPYLKALVLVGIYVGIIFSPVPAFDEVTSLFQKGVDYYNYPETRELSKRIQKYSGKYPFAKMKKVTAPTRKPHIILLTLESFNANFIEAENNEGKAYTPFFNSLIDSSYYLENFYSGSIQTGKGHFSILCSLPPLTQGKAFTQHSDKNFKCLPQILKEFGYQTLFFQGNERVNFDNTFNFVKGNGIDHFVTTDSSTYPKAMLDEIKWGWGIQDNFLYEQALQRMDMMVEKGKPAFMMIATISHHMRFDSVPDEQKILYTDDGGDLKKRFANSIRLADEYLKSFILELRKKPYYKDTLLVITGDHGFPAGEHGIYFPETAAYQESFRVPLLLSWPGKLPQYRDSDLAYSQLDIAPTILDILGGESSHHQMGHSVLDTQKERYQYLVQPYDGIYMGVIKYPYKYLYHVRSGRESLVNLADDPAEIKNIASNQKELLRELREQLSLLWLNDQLIRENRIFPPSLRY